MEEITPDLWEQASSGSEGEDDSASLTVEGTHLTSAQAHDDGLHSAAAPKSTASASFDLQDFEQASSDEDCPDLSVDWEQASSESDAGDAGDAEVVSEPPPLPVLNVEFIYFECIGHTHLNGDVHGSAWKSLLPCSIQRSIH
eukprot:m.217974 g.217974  ORF g.217974 m.217974 type:complete len:142 (+) comp15565_c0_seq6:40-465(+)